jgi:hypothetical protein
MNLLVESRGVITLRPSLLDLYMRLSPHTAPDILSFSLCSCVGIGDTIDVLLQDSYLSNSGDFHLRDVDVLSVPLRTLIGKSCMNGFAVLGL